MTPKRAQQQPATARRFADAVYLSNRVSQLPRIVRILLAALFALAVTLSLSPLVDLIYDHYFFTVETRMAPALVTATIGLMMYLLGWWLMVGTVGEKPAARAATVLYVVIGVLAVVVVVYLIASGVRLMNFEG